LEKKCEVNIFDYFFYFFTLNKPMRSQNTCVKRNWQLKPEKSSIFWCQELKDVIKNKNKPMATTSLERSLSICGLRPNVCE
jgi:hypothetical protein